MPNEIERSRVLCSDHSGRVTEPASCATCKLEKRLTKLVRENAGLRGEVNALREQVRGLENALEAYEQQLAHLENRLDKQQEQEVDA